MRYRNILITEADVPTSSINAGNVALAAAGTLAGASATDTLLKTLTDADMESKLFTVSGGKKLLSAFSKNLFKRFIPQLMVGLGAIWDVYLAWESYAEGDWEGALATLAASGLNLLQITGLVTGGVGWWASLTADFAAMLYASRYELLWPIYMPSREPNKRDPADQALADHMVQRTTALLLGWLWDQLVGFAGYLKSWLPGNWGSKAADTSTPPLPPAAQSTDSPPLPPLPS